MARKPEFCLVLPIYNERASLGAAVRRLRSIMDTTGRSYEVVVSEDGSTDGSYEAAKALEGPRLRVLHSSKRLGKGRAITNAALSTAADVIVFTDVDLSADPGRMAELIAAVEESADIAIGSRLTEGSSIRKRRVLRGFLSRGYNAFIRLLFSTGISDHQCGFKAFRRSSVLPLLEMIESSGWSWDTEFLVRARRKGLKIVEVPVEWTERKDSRLSLVSDVPAMALSVLRLRLKLWGV